VRPVDLTEHKYGTYLTASARTHTLTRTLLIPMRFYHSPTWFSKVKVSAAAASKMLTHAASGVDKGLKSSNAMPVEVMGLMVGHVDTDDPHSLIVTDTFPLPVEGTETTVMTGRCAYRATVVVYRCFESGSHASPAICR
jgi:hypothetical protein